MTETSAATPLDRVFAEAQEATAGRDFPANPVLRRLIGDKAFEHHGETWRAAHKLDAEICAEIGRLIVHRRLSRGLEIGTLFGFATLHLAEALAEAGGRLDTVDLRKAEMMWDRHRAETPKTIRNVHEVAERLIRESGLSSTVRFIEGDSSDVLPRLIREGARYDIALVDGAHDFPTVLTDVIAVDRVLDDGGFLVLDDIGTRIAERTGTAGGPNRVLASLLASGRYAIQPISANVALCRKESSCG